MISSIKLQIGLRGLVSPLIGVTFCNQIWITFHEHLFKALPESPGPLLQEVGSHKSPSHRQIEFDLHYLYGHN